MIRFFTLLAFALASLTLSPAFASDANVPFASDLKSDIRHYNRMTDKIATSGTPAKGAYAELAAHGVETFIDLRTDVPDINAAKAEVEAAGGTYYNIPVYGQNGIQPEQVAAFAKIIDAQKGPVLVNCASGNRAGALWAAYRLSSHTPYDMAIQEGRTAGMKAALEKDVTEKFCTACK